MSNNILIISLFHLYILYNINKNKIINDIIKNFIIFCFSFLFVFIYLYLSISLILLFIKILCIHKYHTKSIIKDIKYK